VKEQGAGPDPIGLRADGWIPFEVAHRRVAQVLGLDPGSAAMWLKTRATANRIEVKDNPSAWGEWEPAGSEPSYPVGPTLWRTADLELELKASTRPQLTHSEVIERYLRYQAACGRQPDPGQASAWLRRILSTGFPAPAGPIQYREYLIDLDVYHPLFSAAELREALDAMTFDAAEIDALLPRPEPLADGVPSDLTDRGEESSGDVKPYRKYDWDIIALEIAETLKQAPSPLKNEAVVAMIQEAARHLELTVPELEAARKMAARWRKALGKTRRE
jgi:hypothetical protein